MLLEIFDRAPRKKLRRQYTHEIFIMARKGYGTNNNNIASFFSFDWRRHSWKSVHRVHPVSFFFFIFLLRAARSTRPTALLCTFSRSEYPNLRGANPSNTRRATWDWRHVGLEGGEKTALLGKSHLAFQKDKFRKGVRGASAASNELVRDGAPRGAALHTPPPQGQ